MKGIRRFFMLLICAALCVGLIGGCGQKKTKKKEEEFITEENGAKNPFDEAGNETVGSIMHGVAWEDESADGLLYDGGELEIPYSMNATGVARSTGFFIFVDGIPQPYKVKEQGGGYEYMHVFELDEGMDATYHFHFVPVAGKQGEALSVCIVSITDPKFMPDMDGTFSYGHSHTAVEAILPISFQEDAGEEAALPGQGSRPAAIASNLERKGSQAGPDSVNLLKENVESVDLDTEVLTELCIEGESMKLAESMDVSGKKRVHVKYGILGHPGLEYRTVFFLNHQPLSVDGENSFSVKLKKGKVETIAFDLETEAFENTEAPPNSTFYAISVPCNKFAYPDDPIGILKTNSILLYKEQAGDE